MSDFSLPVYKSYIELCRELALPRKYQFGDHYIFDNEGDGGEIAVVASRDGFSMPSDIWLPSLSDWLDMLEKEGVDWPAFIKDSGQYIAIQQTGNGPEVDWVQQSDAAPTREEAAARLWMEVKK